MNKINLRELLIPIILIILIGIFGYLFFQEQKKYSYQKIDNKIGITDIDLIKDGRTFIWAGLRGEYPKFNSRKGQKGLGWMEFPVLQIKEKLKKEQNYRILEQYMSPARLEFDFRNPKRPMCTYPYLLKNPFAFAKSKDKTNSLFSIGLELSGDKASRIIFPKTDTYKYIKHLDEKGNLNIESLLRDNNLKTYIINDVDLGPIVNNVIDRLPNGDPFIKKEFSKNIKLYVTNDNVQLLKMMKGKRFDYTFESFISSKHFDLAGFKKDDFTTLTYYQENVLDYLDPKLEISVVRCNRHPLILKIMPIINQYIEERRSETFYKRILAHQSKMDEKSTNNSVAKFDKDIHSRMANDIYSKKIDYWYDEYLTNNKIKWDNEKKSHKFQDKGDLKSIPLEKKTKTKEMMYIYHSKKIIILDSAKMNLVKNIHPYSGFNGNTQNYYPFASLSNRLHEQLMPEDVAIIKNNKYFKFKIDVFKYFNEVESIVISPAGLSDEEVEQIFKFAKKLNKVHIFNPSKSLSGKITRILPRKITELSIVRGSLVNCEIFNFLSESKLEKLDLSNTYLPVGVLEKIIKHNQESLTYLRLAGQMVSINKEFSHVFSQLSLPKLKYLDLSDSNISGLVADKMFMKMPKNIEFLNVFLNYLGPKHFEAIFKQCLDLKSLLVSNSPILSNQRTASNPLILPKSLVELRLINSNLNEDTIDSIIFPEKIEKLDLRDNAIRNTGFHKLLLSLNGFHQLKELSLENLSNTSFFINKLVKDLKEKDFSWSSNLEVLNISNSQINDSLLVKMIKGAKLLQVLNIKNNFISELSIPWIIKHEKLEILDVSMNLLSSSGLKMLFESKAFSNLKEILMLEQVNLPIKHFIKKMPKDLLYLHLSSSLINSQELGELAKVLPKSIYRLALQDIKISDSFIKNFIQNIPINLLTLQLEMRDVEEESAVQLINSLPNDLSMLFLNNMTFNQAHLDFTIPVNLFPQSLEHFSPFYFKIYPEFLIKLLSTLPPTLSIFQTNPRFTESKELADLAKDFGRKHALRRATGFLPNIAFDEDIVKMFPSDYIILKENGITNPFTYKGITQTANSVIKKYKKYLSYITVADLSNTDLEYQEFIDIIKSFSKDLYSLDLKGNKKINLEHVDLIINILPSRLSILDISSLKIGAFGYEKFRKWADKQSEKLGYKIQLIED